MKLRLDPPEKFCADEVYAKLVGLGQDLTDWEARSAMTALLLLLINHIGDEEIVDEAIAVVRGLPSLQRVEEEECHD